MKRLWLLRVPLAWPVTAAAAWAAVWGLMAWKVILTPVVSVVLLVWLAYASTARLRSPGLVAAVKEFRAARAGMDPAALYLHRDDHVTLTRSASRFGLHEFVARLPEDTLAEISETGKPVPLVAELFERRRGVMAVYRTHPSGMVKLDADGNFTETHKPARRGARRNLWLAGRMGTLVADEATLRELTAQIRAAEKLDLPPKEAL